VFTSVSKPHQPEKAYRCPCCGFKTLHERGGYELCPICYWEDDGQDNHDAAEVRGGPNGELSLEQARHNYLHFKVCNPKFLGKNRAPLDDEA